MNNFFKKTILTKLPSVVILLLGMSLTINLTPKAFGQFEEPTTFSIRIALHGMGNSGDSLNPTSAKFSNRNPDRVQRSVLVSVYTTNNQPITSKPGNIVYNYDLNVYSGLIDMDALPSGSYIVKVKSASYLQKRAAGTIKVVKGTTVTIPEITLIAGDINGDNKIDILDYNQLRGCYSDMLPPSFCDDTRLVLSDLSDDGRVNAHDYNLFIRELGQQGD